jgi:hypothetical protein
MLIRCCFAIIVMVDTISFASSQSSFEFLPTIGIVHHVFLQHLDSYSDHATLFLTRVWGGGYKAKPFLSLFIKFFSQESFFHNKLGFLDAHSGHCTATVYIHFMFFFLCNSIIHENFISASFCALYIYMCVHIFLVDYFIPLTGFSLFV